MTLRSQNYLETIIGADQMKFEAKAGEEFQGKLNKDNVGIPQLLAYARKASGRGSFQIGREMLRMMKKPTYLNAGEYVRYALYDDERFSADDKARFLGAKCFWPLCDEVSAPDWRAATEDKWLADTILGVCGQPTTETRAVIDVGKRTYGKTPKITTVEGLRDLLTNAELPLFGKAMESIGSFGAFLITSADASAIEFADRETMSYEAFMNDHVGADPYVLQTAVKNHSFFEGIAKHVATVRVNSLIRDDGLYVPFALLKVPGGNNVADNFWRAGNAVCDLDPDTGEIRTIVTQTKYGLETHETLPATGADLIGKTIPMWDKVLEVAASAGLAFAPVRFQSLDVAITETGPVIIEINTGGGWDLTQMASGRGFLTDEVRDTFRSWGSKLF